MTPTEKLLAALPDAKKSERPRPQERIHILAVVHPDHYLEIFAPRNVDARIITLPSVASIAAEVIAQEYVTATLPKPYQSIYWPSNLRAAATLRTVSVADLAARRADVELLRTLNEIISDTKAATTAKGGAACRR